VWFAARKSLAWRVLGFPHGVLVFWLFAAVEEEDVVYQPF
jgi:hypothetical protein